MAHRVIAAPSVLFVCLGNICRSPLAEGALRHHAVVSGLAITIDSAGTGDWHVGRPPDPRAIAVAKARGVDIGGLRARQVTRSDFEQFSHILALDRANLIELQAIAPATATAQIGLLLDELPGLAGHDVADPYYGAVEDFERAWEQVSRAACALVKRLAR